MGGRQTHPAGGALEPAVHDLGLDPALRRLRSPGEHSQRPSAAVGHAVRESGADGDQCDFAGDWVGALEASAKG
ncbi:hypothetical protein D3C76_1123860 [compost metagenome]